MHVIDSGGLYGAEIMLLNLVGEQIRLGLKPFIASIGVSERDEKPLEKEVRRLGFALLKIHMAPGPNAAGAIRTLRLARRSGACLLHSHGYKSNILLGFIPRKMRGMPIISTLHGWTSTGGWDRMTVYQALDRLALRFVDAVVCVNAAMLDLPGLRRLPRQRLHAIDNGLPCEGIEIPNAREALRQIPDTDAQLFKRRFTIGTIGRLSAEKGYDHLIAALGMVRSEDIDAQLVVIGEGEQRHRLVRLVQRLKLNDHVFFIGYRANARSYIPLFDAYAISSLTEGLPITLLEAMQAGTPVVATRVGGIANVLDGGRAGILVDSADPRSLADGLIKLARCNDIKRNLIRRARERLNAHYSSSGMARNYLRVYRQLVPGL
jgi:glycosyltransferase involved in cell wall biosynthesis